MKKQNWLIALAAGAGVVAVTYSLLSKDTPKGAQPVQPFDLNKYLGLWNEVARLPNLVEKNIESLTEEYLLDEDGSIKVITKGYNRKKSKWTEFTGKIKMAGANDIGLLKVSYFGPLYLAYNVLDIDPDYRYALVSGSGLGFLWILSREKAMPEHIKTQFLNTAKNIGFDVDKLEWL